MTAANILKLYGVPLSQPFRSVAWTLLLKQCPFEVVLAVPGISDKPLGSGYESYVSKTKARSKKIPLLEDGSFALCESPAILSYLCESRGWEKELYGSPGSQRKATIDSYLHWHHSGTRVVALLVAPLINPALGFKVRERDRERALGALEHLEHSWLDGSDKFIVDDCLSIADLLCYEEIAQISLTEMIELDDFPNISSWAGRMRELPFHEEVHASLCTLGSLAKPNEMPMRDRLRAATKAGLSALQQAQHEGVPHPFDVQSKL